LNIGITGHQKLGNTELKRWISEELRNEIRRLKPTMAYSCLAIGADQIFTRVILEEGIHHTAIVPCKDYQSTFKKSDLDGYVELLNLSIKIDELDFFNCSEYAFLQAGKHMVQKSDIIFAIWDGKKAKGLGGTADIVEYAISDGKKVIHLNLILKTIITYK